MISKELSGNEDWSENSTLKIVLSQFLTGILYTKFCHENLDDTDRF